MSSLFRNVYVESIIIRIDNNSVFSSKSRHTNKVSYLLGMYTIAELES
jgi:hypothetical protein